MASADAMLLALAPVPGLHVEEGPLRWADLPPPWLLTLIVLAGFFWIRGLYVRERGPAGGLARFGLACLRTLVLVLVILVLGGPFRQVENKVVERSHLVVLVDGSASMNVKDAYLPADEQRLLDHAFREDERPGTLAQVSRGDLVRRTLSDEGAGLLRAWSKRFVLHVFAFDDEWRSLGTTEPRGDAARQAEPTDAALDDILARLGTLRMDGGRTRLGGVLRNAANEFARRQDQHLAGVVLLSDGRDTSDGEPPQQVLATMGAVKEELRVAAVGVGNPASGKNLWVERIRAKEWVLVRDEVLFETALGHTGFEDHRGPVEVTMAIEKVAEEDGEPVDPPRPYEVPEAARRSLEREITRLGRAARDGTFDATETTPVRIQAPFHETGTFRVSIRARFLDAEDRRLDSVPEDDVRTHELRVVDQRIRVLYVDNLPRHDWRFLSNFLTREPGKQHEALDAAARSRFQVHVLLQSADPAFRQPASIGETPIKQFPRTRRELFAYDVLILGDVDWRKFDRSSVEGSRKVLELISDFVEEGGGLALQAGVDYANPLDFLGTPLAALVPLNVQTQDKAESDRFDQRFNLALTPAGRQHPIFGIVPGADGGSPTPVDIDMTWAGGTPLSEDWHWYWLYRAPGGLRPGAVDLARVRAADRTQLTDQRGEPLVVMASMAFGKGQVFWSGLDTISRIRRSHRDRYYGAFWEQVIRYLATYRLLGGNKRFKIFTDKDAYFVGETATLTITALDEYFEPLRDEYLDGVHVEMPDDTSATGATLLTDEGRPRLQSEEGAVGTYRLVLPLKKQGLVRVWIDRGEAGAARGSKERAEKRFDVDFRAREDILKVPDHETLRDIAKVTNPGAADVKVLRLYEVADAVARMQAQPRERVIDRRERTQWDKAWVLLLITVLLAVEWILRKRWQMI